MHLLINGLSARLGGGQTYLHQLLRHVPTHWRVTLLTSGGFDAAGTPVTCIAMPQLTNPFRRAWWERTQLENLASQNGCDLIFNPACLLPHMRSKKIKTAVTFQNMLPFDHIQRKRYAFFSYRRLRDYLLEKALTSTMRRADLVIFISAYARDFITRERHVTPKNAALISHAVDPVFFPVSGSKNYPHLDGILQENEPYFLYVSFIDFYKSQREMVRAYAALRTRYGITIKLLLVGTGYARYMALLKQDIAVLGLEDSVILLGNIPHDALPALYQNATLNLFASTVENCPNILLEIMASGCPALVSRRGPMPEIAGDSVAYFDPDNHEEFVVAWHEALHDTDAARKATLAMERAKQHRWNETAEATWRAMEQVVNAP